MISKKSLKSYNFNSMDQYFDYILESEVNGQFEQVEKLIIELSKPQRIDLFEYLRNGEQSEYRAKCIGKLLKLLKV
jgi:hypothetical protein